MATVPESVLARRVVERASSGQRMRDLLFRAGLLLCLFITVLFLGVLLIDVAIDGVPLLTPEFITNFPSRLDAGRSGVRPALIGTLYLGVLCAAFIVPIGVAAAVYLEEYADPNRWWNRVIEVNIQNLASVPSVVYGILGLAFIVRGPVDIWGLGQGSPTLLAGRADARPARAARRDHRLARGAAGRAAVDPRGFARARGDEVADDLEAGPARGARGHRHGRDPRPVAGDRRDGAADPRGGDGVPALGPDGRRPFSALPIAIFGAAGEPREEFQILAAGRDLRAARSCCCS